ncbi:MAG TPA: glycosyltransferase family 9 protein [Bdellovibrionales bacterium]|nr:heptosyltransferase [Pseudobdellovibrionaceae bacterium]HAG91355.1 glycosyltransferase family 9 protein [Bdellovibrionales bacterium]|tara:strand:+ start:316 stop:1320 length:1005 start_codon:yes stop_codon:yes gene_type:complete
MRILLLRFSSIGDVLQTLSVVSLLKSRTNGDVEIHVATQSRFLPFFEAHPAVHKVWSIPKSSGLKPLWKMSGELADAKFTHVYDAHNNLRSQVLVLMLRLRGCFFKFLRRPIYRFRRFLLFRFRINLFEQPFSGQKDQIRPLKKWGYSTEIPTPPHLFLSKELIQKTKQNHLSHWPQFTALAPSAAYPLKRWPLDHWKDLIRNSSEEKFVLLGGPEDSFLEDLEKEFPSQVLNLAGKLDLMESAAVVHLSRALVSNDTGVMHMAEQLGHPCVALMGPAPFGYPSMPSTRVLERNLKCRPCSKHGQGPCVNKEFQKCLRDIPYTEVQSSLKEMKP